MQLRSTYEDSTRQSWQLVHNLHDHELAAIHAAIEDRTLTVGIVDNSTNGIASGEFVAIATADAAESFSRSDAETIDQLKRDLTRALEELKSASEIVREVFNESEPSDHVWRIEDALYDVEKAIDYASDSAEEL